MTPEPLEVSSITEGRDFEAKLAGGRDGRGELPQDIFETYSAFANTEGGVSLLGLREKKDHGFEVAGIADTAKVKSSLGPIEQSQDRQHLGQVFGGTFLVSLVFPDQNEDQNRQITGSR